MEDPVPIAAHFLRVSRILRANPAGRAAGGAAVNSVTGPGGKGGRPRTGMAGSSPRWPGDGTGSFLPMRGPSLSRGFRSVITGAPDNSGGAWRRHDAKPVFPGATRALG